MGMCGPQDPLFTPLLPFTRSQVEAQVCSQALIWKKNVTFLLQKQTFLRKYDNFDLQKLKFDFIFHQKACGKFCKISVLTSKAPIFEENPLTAPTFIAIYPLTSPQVRKSGPHIPTRKKVEYPPGLAQRRYPDRPTMPCDKLQYRYLSGSNYIPFSLCRKI